MFVLDSDSLFLGDLPCGLLSSLVRSIVLFFVQTVRFVGFPRFVSKMFSVFVASASAFSGASNSVRNGERGVSTDFTF